MYIVAIAWMYVVLMMSIAEHSVIAGIMTFLMYGIAPLTIILYLTGGRRRKRRRALAKKQMNAPEEYSGALTSPENHAPTNAPTNAQKVHKQPSDERRAEAGQTSEYDQ
jgi:small-conductance mechanosensitive channel